MSWVELSLLASLIWASVNIIDKVLLTKVIKHPVVSVIILSMTGVVIVPFILHQIPVPITPELMILGLVGGVFYFAANYSYFQAVQREEVSRVIPVISTTPLFLVFLGALFLNEQLSLYQYVGVALLVGGAILVSIRKKLSLTFNTAFVFALGCAFFFALNQLATKNLLDLGYNFWGVFAYIRLGTALAAIPFVVKHWRDLTDQYRQKGLRSYALVTGTELLNLLAVLIFTIAVSEGPVTLVNALSSIQPFFVLILAVLVSLGHPHILKEEIGGKTIGLKVVAIIGVIIGAILVTS